MKFVLSLAISLALLLNIAVTQTQSNADTTLIKYLMQSPLSTSDAPNDPATTAACFAQYLPMLSSIADTFHTQYQACITTANQQIAALAQQAALEQQNLMEQTASICNAYQACQSDTGIVEFFNCYASVSNQDISIVYSISTNATAQATEYTQALEEIQVNQNLCTNATEQRYVTNTAAAYDLLDNCLRYGLPATTTDTTETTETTVTTATSAAPTAASPAAPTTASPAVTTTASVAPTTTMATTAADGVGTVNATAAHTDTPVPGSVAVVNNAGK